MTWFYISLFITALIIAIAALSNHALKEIVCTEHSGTYELSGQFHTGSSSALLPSPLGIHQYTITVHRGRFRLSHNTYHPDEGTWTLPPLRGKKPFYDLHKPGTYTIEIHIGEHSGVADALCLVNVDFRKKAEFSYSIKPV